MGENSWNGYERNCLFANRDGNDFVDVGWAVAADSQKDSRGAAVADFDGDGRLDLAITNNDAPPTLLVNRLPEVGHRVTLELVGTESNRDAVGARVRLSSGGRRLSRWVEAGSGYASQSAHALHFGLGASTGIDALEIDWPSGLQQRLEGAELAAAVRLDDHARLVEPAGAQSRTRAESTKGEG